VASHAFTFLPTGSCGSAYCAPRFRTVHHDSSGQRATCIAAAINHAKECINMAQQQQAEYANRSRKEVTFKRGDKVLLSTRYLTRRSDEGVKKLDRLWVGPFAVTEQIGQVS
jgi:hypothetical protein